MACGDPVSTSDATAAIVESMIQQEPNQHDVLVEAMGGWLDGSPDCDSFKLPATPTNPRRGFGEVGWDAYEEASNEYREKVLAEFKANLPVDMDLYVFEFSDNDGSYFFTLEHGDTFH